MDFTTNVGERDGMRKVWPRYLGNVKQLWIFNETRIFASRENPSSGVLISSIAYCATKKTSDFVPDTLTSNASIKQGNRAGQPDMAVHFYAGCPAIVHEIPKTETRLLGHQRLQLRPGHPVPFFLSSNKTNCCQYRNRPSPNFIC